MIYICKQCGLNFNKKLRSKSKSNDMGYCSYSCHRKTDQFKIGYKKTFIANRCDKDVNRMSIDEIHSTFHMFKSENVKKSQHKRVKTIKNKSENEFSRMARLGGKNRKIKFLFDNNIIQKDKKMTEKQVNKLFKIHFNKISGHGGKIRDGLAEKYGDRLDKMLNGRHHKGIINFIKKQNIDASSLTEEQYDEFVNQFNKQHAYKDVIQWKSSHLINQLGYTPLQVSRMSKKKISKLYSQYMIDRMEHLVESLKNGYRCTKKGYYQFNNLNKKLFYRSSWEEKFLSTADNMIQNNIIFDVRVPQYVYYKYDGLKRKYFPDFAIITQKGMFVVEIKPKSKLKWPMNKAKIKSAKIKYKNIFYILTEQNIFGNLKQDILNIIGDNT